MTLLTGLLVLSLQASTPGGIYRYTDPSGGEHFINDPSLAPPEAKDTLQPVDLTRSSETSTPARSDAPPAVAGASAEVRWRDSWLWASLIAAVLFFVLAIANAAVPSRYRRVSWALAVGRLVSVFLLMATLVAASYELRNDPAMRRYSPWAALDQFQQAKLEAIKRTALQEAAPEPDAKKSGQAR